MSQAGPPSSEGGSSSVGRSPDIQPGEASHRLRTPAALMSELAGSLPCVRCKYDLKGLSILAQCPECGTPIRATLLAVVDPRASELQPIDRPRLTALGLVTWASAAFATVLCGWALWLITVLPVADASRHLPALRVAVMAFTALSGLGAFALVAPHAGIRPRNNTLAAAGAAAYLPLLALLWFQLFKVPNAGSSSAPVTWASTDTVHTLLSLGIAVCTAAIIVLLRPNARILAARSVLLREGRVDRQTLLGLACVLVLAVVGDSLSLIGLTMQAGETVLLLGQSLLLISCLLFTVGLIGVVIDCLRIRPVVLQPPLSLESLLEPPATPPGSKPRP